MRRRRRRHGSDGWSRCRLLKCFVVIVCACVCVCVLCVLCVLCVCCVCVVDSGCSSFAPSSQSGSANWNVRLEKKKGKEKKETKRNSGLDWNCALNVREGCKKWSKVTRGVGGGGVFFTRRSCT